mgnify:CR=1 FL=1
MSDDKFKPMTPEGRAKAVAEGKAKKMVEKRTSGSQSSWAVPRDPPPADALAPLTQPRAALEMDAPQTSELSRRPRSKVITTWELEKIDVVDLGTFRLEDMADERRYIGAQVGYYGALRDEARKRLAELKLSREKHHGQASIIEAEAMLEVRKGKPDGTKPTVDEAKALVATHHRVKDHGDRGVSLAQQIIDAEFNYDQLGTVLAALRSKQEAMISASIDQHLERKTTVG